MLRRSRLALAVLFLVTCGGLTHFTITQKASATIPAGTLLEQLAGGLGFGSLASFDLTQSQELKNQGVTRNEISSVKLTSLTLQLTSPPSGQDFTFLDSLSFFVEAAGQEKKEVARGGPFPKDMKTVTLTVLDVELAPYAAAPSMTFTTTASGHRPTNETTLEATVVLGVDVNLPGLVCGGK